MNRSPRKWGLFEWAAVATLLSTVIGVVALYFTVLDRGRAEAEPSATSTSSEVRPNSTSAPSKNPPTTSTSLATAVRFLSNQQDPSDGQEIPFFNGHVEAGGVQEINGKQFVRNLNFGFVCSDTSDKFADYNLGRHFSRFTAVIGPSDISKSQAYHFEVWKDDQRAYSVTLRHGQSRRIDMSIRDVLKLRVAACSSDESVIIEQEGGGIFGDPQVIGDADKVPPVTSS
jgi:hypothetical protein